AVRGGRLEAAQDADTLVRAAAVAALRRLPMLQPAAGFSIDLDGVASSDASGAVSSAGSPASEVADTPHVDETSTVIGVSGRGNGEADSAAYTPDPHDSGVAGTFATGVTPTRP